MVVRKMTPEERAAWLGNGRVLFGMKRPDFFPTNSQPSAPASPEDPKPLDLQNLPFDPAEAAMSEGGLLRVSMKSDYAQQRNLDQEAHDKRMAKMTPQERAELAKRLAKLARSKLMSEPDFSSSEPSQKPSDASD